MKKSFLVLYVLCLAVTFCQAQSIKLPDDCKKILNKNFRGWKFAQVSKKVSRNYKENKSPFEPNLVRGDWNGDGKIDYAALIEYRKKSKTIAFIRLQNTYKHYNLDGGDYIQVFRKGEKDYSYTSDKNFIYKNDSIFVGIGECCGSSYIWRKGKFVGIVTSD
jgi:hypothetical protein